MRRQIYLGTLQPGSEIVYSLDQDPASSVPPIRAGAAILGLKLDITYRASGDLDQIFTVHLSKSDGTVSESRSFTVFPTLLPTPVLTGTPGGDSDLFGLTWTVEELSGAEIHITPSDSTAITFDSVNLIVTHQNPPVFNTVPDPNLVPADSIPAGWNDVTQNLTWPKGESIYVSWNGVQGEYLKYRPRVIAGNGTVVLEIWVQELNGAVLIEALDAVDASTQEHTAGVITDHGNGLKRAAWTFYPTPDESIVLDLSGGLGFSVGEEIGALNFSGRKLLLGTGWPG